MRHHIVTRIVVSMVVLSVAAIALFAWGVTRPVGPGVGTPSAGEGPTGEALFVGHCAMCHDAEATGLDYRAAPDRAAAAAAFRAFLEDHYGPSPDGIALIVSHLMGAAIP